MLHSKSYEMKDFFRRVLRGIVNAGNDTSGIEKRWVEIYRQSIRSRFYSFIGGLLEGLSPSGTMLEHGCSIGNVALKRRRTGGHVMGIDKSFYAILEAKKQRLTDSDFLVADSLEPPFGSKKFDTVLGLNLLDIVEPYPLIRTMADQVDRYLVLSDPYDFERGKLSVREKVSPEGVRSYLENIGFKMIHHTEEPAQIPWRIKVNSRLELDYKVDVIVAERA
ncbi:MAG: methyltransferase domain-containing protein [Thaumarchaeota archaeon]|nr:methyltransferase domain-containing protein [Nitrososphaerota archaeon]